MSLTRSRTAGLRAAGLGLLALGLSALGPPQATQQEARQRFEEIQRELRQEMRDLNGAAKDLAGDEVGELYQDFNHNVLPDFIARFAELAREVKGSDIAYDAWSQVVSLGMQAENPALAREGLAVLTSDHIESEQLLGLTQNLRYAAEGLGEELTLEGLRKIAAGSPHRTVQASALYSLGAVLGDGRPADDPRFAQALEVFGRLSSEYGDVNYFDGRSYAAAAEGFVFALQNLRPGQSCPDFQAMDAEGAGFKLSDYRGKVVLVDFWGFW